MTMGSLVPKVGSKLLGAANNVTSAVNTETKMAEKTLVGLV